MPLIHSTDLIGLSVVTENGQQLGKVCAFDIDTEAHSVARYYVRPHRLLAVFSREDFCIHPAQVVHITKEAMVVRDAVVTEKDATKNERLGALTKDAVPILPTERS